MELVFDWVGYQEVFHPRVKSNAAALPHARPTRVLVDAGVVLEVFADGDDLSDWVGADFEQMARAVPGREFVVIEKSRADESIAQALELTQFHLQQEILARTPASRTSGARYGLPAHFVMDALQSGWARVLPSSYAVFVRLEGQSAGQERDFIVVVRRGEVAAFHRPDLSFLSAERRKNPADLVKYLSDKYMVPVQGLFVEATLWNDWCQAPSPWRCLAQALRKNQAKLVPWRWSVAAWVGARGLLKA